MYRIMVLGEDGVEFCHKNDVHGFDLLSACREARETYENCEVWVEHENS